MSLAAYVVPNLFWRKAEEKESANRASTEIVSQWQSLYEETYSTGAQEPSFVGWNSSYTGLPIPAAQMREWLAATVERIQALRPRKLLEIGCGTGLLVQHLAPECEVYVATDFSHSALKRLAQWMSRRDDLRHVQLLRRSATELQDWAPGSFDTIVLNSVVQYFPDVEYLLAVLQATVRLLKPGGHVFIGDVRHLALLPAFHSVVQLSKAAETVTVAQLRKRIARAVQQEKELVIDPRFFAALPERLAGVSSVDIQLKRGLSQNELTQYRYDVVLQMNGSAGNHPPCETRTWKTEVQSLAALEAALAERRVSTLCVRSIPNARLGQAAAAKRLIETSDERLQASVLRRQLSTTEFDALEPESFWKLGGTHDYCVQVCWGAHDSPETFDVYMWVRGRAPQAPPAPQVPDDKTKPWREYTNTPLDNTLSRQIIPELREYLKRRVPEYMIPANWIVLQQLPLTHHGKIDRNALLTSEKVDSRDGLMEPRNPLERTLTKIFADFLRFERVGIDENFFEIGGHSLLAAQATSRIRQELGVELSLGTFYSHPTAAMLAEQLGERRVSRTPAGRVALKQGGNSRSALCFFPTMLGLALNTETSRGISPPWRTSTRSTYPGLFLGRNRCSPSRIWHITV